jgi:hypothetical protein
MLFIFIMKIIEASGVLNTNAVWPSRPLTVQVRDHIGDVNKL